jgi:hypothetical protein
MRKPPPDAMSASGRSTRSFDLGTVNEVVMVARIKSRRTVMWWLTYRRSGTAVGVVVVEAPSLIEARLRVALEAVEADVDFAEGHELDAALAALVPAEQLDRMLSIEEANQLLKRVEEKPK